MTALGESDRLDYRQLRALVRAHALTDYSALLGHDGSAAALRAVGRRVAAFVVGGLMSFGAAAIIWLAPDVFYAASVTAALTMFVVGMLTVTTAVSLVGPDDFEIVGFRPVSSTTYFAARAAALLLGTAEAAVPIGWLPVVTWFARSGGSVGVAMAAAVAIAASSCVVTLGLAAFYGLLMRVVHPRKVTRAILTAQTLGFILLFSAYWMPFARQGTLKTLASVTLPDSPVVLLFPGTWFGSYVVLAGGRAGSVIWLAAAVSIVAIAVAAWAITGPLSVYYTTALGEQASDAAPRASISLTRFGRLRAERRAVLVLLASQARANLTVQAGLLSGMLMVVVMGGVFFAESPDGAAFALLFGPLNQWSTLQRTSEHEAIWPFFTSPCSRALAITTARDAVAVFVLVPLVLLLMAVHLVAGTGVQSLSHVAASGLGSYLTLQLAVIANPVLPFSLPMLGRQLRVFMNFAAMIGGSIIVFAIRIAFYSRVGVALALVGTVLTAAALNKVTYWRIQRLEGRPASSS